MPSDARMYWLAIIACYLKQVAFAGQLVGLAFFKQEHEASSQSTMLLSGFRTKQRAWVKQAIQALFLLRRLLGTAERADHSL